MKSAFACILALFALFSVALATPSQSALDARAEKVNEIRALRKQLNLATRKERRQPPAGPGAPGRGPAGQGPPGQNKAGPQGPPAGGPPGLAKHLQVINGHVKNTNTDPDHCGAPFFTCPESYNGVGQRFCDFGKCKLNCPPGLAQTIHKFFPDITFCWLESFVRWDTVHFVHIALRGYQQDQQTAFLPGLPTLMRLGGEAIHRLVTGAGSATASEVVFFGIIASTVASAAAAVVLQRLTLQLFPTRADFAATTAIVFLLAPSRATLHAVPYTEPFAALFTFLGMLLFLRDRDVLAATSWACGSAFRAQGIILGVGFFGWKWILQRTWTGGPGFSAVQLRRLAINVPVFAALSLLAVTPFLAFQVYVFRRFCSDSSGLELHPWCTEGSGMSYGWVQREYWNSGFLRYWRPLQLPNFLLAGPVLALSFASSYAFYTSNPEATWRATIPFLAVPARLKSAPHAAENPAERLFVRPIDPATARRLGPFVHLSTFITALLFLAHHVQIILRVVVTNPVPFWYVAELIIRDETGKDPTQGETPVDGASEKAKSEKGEESRWGRLWIQYCIAWGTLSVVLWAVFLPPA